MGLRLKRVSLSIQLLNLYIDTLIELFSSIFRLLMTRNHRIWIFSTFRRKRQTS